MNDVTYPTHLEPPTRVVQASQGTLRVLLGLVRGALLAFVVDTAGFGLSRISTSLGLVFVGGCWIMIALWIIVFRERWAIAIGFALALPAWPFIALVCLTLASGIKC